MSRGISIKLGQDGNPIDVLVIGDYTVEEAVEQVRKLREELFTDKYRGLRCSRCNGEALIYCPVCDR